MGKVGSDRVNDYFEMFLGIIVCVVAMCFVGLGYGAGQASIANDCKAFGAFKHIVIYECKEKSK